MAILLAIIVALLLFEPVTVSVAEAADDSERFTQNANATSRQKKSQKILAMMRSIGMAEKDAQHVITSVNNNVRDGRVMLYQQKIEGGSLVLRYDLNPDDNVKKLGLVYTPKDSNTEYSVRSNAAMVNYKLKF